MDSNNNDFMAQNGFYQCEIDDFHNSWRTRFVVNGKHFKAEFILTLLKDIVTEEKSIELYVKMHDSSSMFCLYDEDSDSFEHDLGSDGNIWNIIYDFCQTFQLNPYGSQYIREDKCRDFELVNNLTAKTSRCV